MTCSKFKRQAVPLFRTLDNNCTLPKRGLTFWDMQIELLTGE